MIISFGYGYTGKREMSLMAESIEEDALLLQANRAVNLGKLTLIANADDMNAEWSIKAGEIIAIEEQPRIKREGEPT